MILRVTQFGEPILRHKGKRVEVFDDELKQLVSDMVETMHEHEGAGLAAQQVDKNLLLFVIDLSWHEELNEMPYTLDDRKPPLDMMMPMAFVNAEVKLLRGDVVTAEEGCLSFPGIRGEVPRAEYLQCTYQDLDGGKHVLTCGDWLARVIQHEYDHTQGILFIDRMDARTQKRLDPRLKRLRRANQSAQSPKNRGE